MELPTTSGTFEIEGIVPPLQVSGLMGVLLTQAVGLGFVGSPRWGSPARALRLGLAAFLEGGHAVRRLGSRLGLRPVLARTRPRHAPRPSDSKRYIPSVANKTDASWNRRREGGPACDSHFTNGRV